VDSQRNANGDQSKASFPAVRHRIGRIKPRKWSSIDSSDKGSNVGTSPGGLRSQRRTAPPVGSPWYWSVSFRPNTAHSEKIEY
jgi:hypothetical protein